MSKVEIPTDPGTYLLAVIVDGRVDTSLARVTAQGRLWSEYLGEPIPSTATFVRVPDSLIDAVEQRAKDKYVAQMVDMTARVDSWEIRAQLKRLRVINIALFDVVWATLPDNVKGFFSLKGLE